uniref:Putative ovule protein n=1 Tax=Solanum chacoense TaxID=4108 RepID=A0A0V0HJ77_SOLCH
MNLHKYNTTKPNSTWELILPQRNLRWYTPFVFALGRKIYVISANKLIPAGDECENPIGHMGVNITILTPKHGVTCPNSHNIGVILMKAFLLLESMLLWIKQP